MRVRKVLLVASILAAVTVAARAAEPTAGASDVEKAAVQSEAPIAPELVSGWTERPTAMDMAWAYPDKAIVHDLGGTVRLRCRIAANLRLEACSIWEETPSGFGFGKASLKIAPKFRAKPRLKDGRSAQGTLLEIPIRWSLH